MLQRVDPKHKKQQSERNAEMNELMKRQLGGGDQGQPAAKPPPGPCPCMPFCSQAAQAMSLPRLPSCQAAQVTSQQPSLVPGPFYGRPFLQLSPGQQQSCQQPCLCPSPASSQASPWALPLPAFLQPSGPSHVPAPPAFLPNGPSHQPAAKPRPCPACPACLPQSVIYFCKA